MSSPLPIARLRAALPYMMPFLLIPVLWLCAIQGGWWLAVPFMMAWHMFSVMDMIMGLNTDNADPETPDDALTWYRVHLAAWVPIQMISLFAMIAYAVNADHLSAVELAVLFFDVGVVSGTVGIVYAHELMHQRAKWERWLGDILMSMALYGFFRSEHLLVHHPYVGTPRDAVTARYNEGFHRFFLRVLRQTPGSAWRAEAAMLARRSLPAHHISNPFWRYGALAAVMVGLAIWVGGWIGLLLLMWQAFCAVWQLELTDYVEHYGLTREHLGDGKYEHVKPRHSWNAAHRATNWLLINLQRHSDHHYKPARRYPLLQNYEADEAPQLPWGYTVMGMIAMVPPVWRRYMNPRVRAWRKHHYPHITDWAAYNAGTTPMPR